ncbi:thiamine phosphate synthase [Leptospira sp. 2 VSF19]|uniref:Thiamine-phosphate synthase n=1 Tax=Leptospira soteropolitanensis TaxID=2950025 RepID=A0AAW5VLQ8_9LEPT|nr:thiamine phosphate synthase [Leptospira soteropolitanensis]MCW7493490.1 thiamine phosphate synthase [Leptospira soteropolitanensis]MCW7500978.1 thiamine phosphate synthase [Leptospira soteropolitanensis]MCW7523342.1 thiamine phosphate synthase [Leptospira soteropolitanensis]MCW7527203.1 thiamine phosphate synthase [Leptospira soteropolitanensis]MCW7531060.1 thiamine phosphate synthase [Leptospira soteropolitanensis]
MVNKKQIRGVYLVTDRPLCIHHNLAEVVKLAAFGGVSFVQLREKEADSRTFLELAKHLKTILTPFSIPLLINDRLDICLAAGADGVHLGQSDLPWWEARRLLGNDAFIGLSLETKEDYHSLIQLDPNPSLDYLAVSPVFDTDTKTNTKPAWGLEGLKWLRSKTTIPIVAIGGIKESNAEAVIQAGADSIAVVSAICSAKDPKLATEILSDKFHS